MFSIDEHLTTRRNVGSRPYSNSDLLRFRFVNRKQSLHPRVRVIIVLLGIMKQFNIKCGAPGGQRIKMRYRSNCSIPVIVSDVHSWNPCPSRGVSQSNLIYPQIIKNLYLMPRILMANVRSLANKFDQTLARITCVNPDIAVFTETWITEINTDGFEIEGFRSFHRIRDRSDKSMGGGVSIYLSESYSCLSANFPTEDSVEAMSLMVRSSLMPREIPWFGLIAVYSPPVDLFAGNCMNFITNEIDRLLSVNSNAVIFVLGDLNDMKMDFVTSLRGFKPLISSPTRGSNILDNCYMNSKLNFSTEIQAPIGASDHSSIVIFSSGIAVVKNEFKSIEYRPKKRSSMIGFANVISKVDWFSLLTPLNCECATSLFHDFVSVIYETCFPVVTKRIKNNDKSWFNDEIANLIKRRNILFKRGYKTEEKGLAILIKKKIEEAKAKEADVLFKSIKSGSFDFYKLLSRSAGIVERSGFASFPDRSSSQSFDEIAEFYFKQGTLFNPIQNQSLPAFCPWLPLETVSEAYVLKELMAINPRGPRSPDNIPCFIFSMFADILTQPITILINKSLVEAVCPSVWKSSFIICIPKVKCPSDPRDIRPIAISSVIAKIIERKILGCLLPQIIGELDGMQFGGIPRRSSAQYLTFYIDYVLRSLEKGNAGVVAVITDFSKAFNTVDHNIFV